MATKPDPAPHGPLSIDVEAGKTYYWCSCGKSSKQPFCDGQHAGSDFQPLPVKEETARSRTFCGCKQTSTPPYCDGSHLTA